MSDRAEEEDDSSHNAADNAKRRRLFGIFIGHELTAFATYGAIVYNRPLRTILYKILVASHDECSHDDLMKICGRYLINPTTVGENRDGESDCHTKSIHKLHFNFDWLSGRVTSTCMQSLASMLLGNTTEIADACRLFANTMEEDVVWDSSQTMIRLGAASVYQRLHIVTESPRNVAVSSADPRFCTAEKIEHMR